LGAGVVMEKGILKSEHFQEELDTIINDDIKEFATMLLNNTYDYLLTKPSSSTGKYHSQYALGKGGLLRHSKAVCRMLNWILSLEQHSRNFTEREMDLIRVACLFHDAEKYGRTDDSKHTVHEHPMLAAGTVRGYKGSSCLPDDELDYIADAIASHSGQWTTTKKSAVVLPKPRTPEQMLIHLADYLCSRSAIEIQFDGYAKPPLPELSTYVIDFGKYDGELLVDVAKKDMGYVEWLRENYGKWPVKALIAKLYKEQQ